MKIALIISFILAILPIAAALFMSGQQYSVFIYGIEGSRIKRKRIIKIQKILLAVQSISLVTFIILYTYNLLN